jgi:hypothetical protein
MYLLDQIKDLLPSDILDEVLKDLHSLKKDAIGDKLEKAGIDVNKIPERIMEGLVDAVGADMLEKMM